MLLPRPQFENLVKQEPLVYDDGCIQGFHCDAEGLALQLYGYDEKTSTILLRGIEELRMQSAVFSCYDTGLKNIVSTHGDLHDWRLEDLESVANDKVILFARYLSCYSVRPDIDPGFWEDWFSTIKWIPPQLTTETDKLTALLGSAPKFLACTGYESGVVLLLQESQQLYKIYFQQVEAVSLSQYLFSSSLYSIGPTFDFSLESIESVTEEDTGLLLALRRLVINSDSGHSIKVEFGRLKVEELHTAD